VTRPILIGLAGKARAGKDSVAAHLIARYGFARYAFADALRDAALALDPIIDNTIEWIDGSGTLRFLRLSEVVEADGWEAAKEHPEVRRTLQHYGVAIREIEPDFWVRTAMREAAKEPRPVVVTDVRFPNEVDAIREAGGVVVRVVRPGANGNGHISETAIDHIAADYTIRNVYSLDDLGAAVDHVIEAITYRPDLVIEISAEWDAAQ
jgi:hypothetical protein